jgi:hypothetical protein
MMDDPDKSPLLNAKEMLRIQQIIGTLLYYARAIDSTLVVPLSAIASEQSNATEYTHDKSNQLLDYCATLPTAILQYVTSNMQLQVHSDASYLNEPKARSHIGGHFYMTNKPPKLDLIHNGAILNPTGVLKVVVSSAAEAEVGALFVNGKEIIPTRPTLEELGHKQDPIGICTNNTTAFGIVNSSVQQK